MASVVRHSQHVETLAAWVVEDRIGESAESSLPDVFVDDLEARREGFDLLEGIFQFFLEPKIEIGNGLVGVPLLCASDIALRSRAEKNPSHGVVGQISALT